jgi:hypothetical protein
LEFVRNDGLGDDHNEEPCDGSEADLSDSTTVGAITAGITHHCRRLYGWNGGIRRVGFTGREIDREQSAGWFGRFARSDDA